MKDPERSKARRNSATDGGTRIFPVMTTPTSTRSTCPSCGAPASGRFCAECGAPFDGATCGECRALLTPGAKFCHRCGTPAGQPASSHATLRGAVPWAVAAIALLSLVAMVAGKNLAPTRGSGLDGPQNAIPTPGLDDRGAESASPPRAPDISSLSPEQAADRLFDRIMRLSEQGRVDSVQFFAPMAIASYDMLRPLDADKRFHLGMIALATRYAEMIPVARAQADTILATDATHLLGLALAVRSARAANDTASAGRFQRRLREAAPAERQRGRPEYELHRPIIDDALGARQ